MEKKYLGQIECKLSKVMVYATKEGYSLSIYRKEYLIHECNLLDDDHVYRELQSMGYKKSYIKVILSML